MYLQEGKIEAEDFTSRLCRELNFSPQPYLVSFLKSRSRQEDPEQLRLKQKAKEMQELLQLRSKEANLMALAIVGPRKMRKMEAAAAGAENMGSGSCPSASGSASSGASRQFTRQSITRVDPRDMLFCLENERETSHSHFIDRSFLKKTPHRDRPESCHSRIHYSNSLK
nr:transcription initiation factor TFIID subunit 4-like [Oncorhynchus nerka]